MGLVARIMLFLGGIVASFVVARDATNFPFISFVAAMLMFTGFVAVLAFWPYIVRCVRRCINKDEAE